LAFFIALLSFNSRAVLLTLTLEADDKGTPEDVGTDLTEETAGEDTTRGTKTRDATRGGDTMRGADTGFL
jgi:hypothetical protein